MQDPTLQPSEMLKFLEEPLNYPHQPSAVEVAQTHASYVAITEDYVYKLKKPVDLGFMDFTSPQKRRNNAIREVNLNRRLAEEVYLGVVPLTITQEGEAKLLDEYKNPEEVPEGYPDYAVKMITLESDYFFKVLMEEGQLKTSDLDRIINKLVSFYQNQSPNNEVLSNGQIENIKKNTHDNFRVLYKFIGKTLSQPVLDGIKYFTDQFFECNEELFHRRIQEKKILDLHGDLHLDHIHLHPDRLSIFDCIEFNNRFRYIDIANDLAFLAMDLDYIGKHEWSRYIVEQMEEQLKDDKLKELTDFYKVYRACVRGKVESIKSSEQEVEEEDRQEAFNSAQSHLELALRYTIAGSGPLVLIVIGNIATGKSTLAENLAPMLNWPHYDSDRVRKNLAGIEPTKPTPDHLKQEIYAPDFTDKVYDQLKSEALKASHKKEGIILDATYGRKKLRENLTNALKEHKAPFTFIETHTDEQTIIERLKERAPQEHQPSDARIEDFSDLYHRYEPPKEVEQKNLIQINTALSKQENQARVFKELIDNRL